MLDQLQPKTAKAFTKGQQVTYLHSWDDKGTVSFKNAVVYSCGPKQMVLTDAGNGAEMGRHFSPVEALRDLSNRECYHGHVFPRLTSEEVNEIGLRLAAKYLVFKREHYERCLKNERADERYCAAIRRNMAELHEPRVIDKTGTTL